MHKDSDIYYNRELLILSKEKRQLDLITITSWDKMTTIREPALKNLFPQSSKNNVRPYM